MNKDIEELDALADRLAEDPSKAGDASSMRRAVISALREVVAELQVEVRVRDEALARVEALAAKRVQLGGNVRSNNPTLDPGWEGKAKDYERQARAIRRAVSGSA